MKILFVCHRVPYPPKRGGKIRPFNIIRHFTDQGHDVTVASLARTEAERDEAKDLSKHCAKTLIEVIPNSAAYPRMVGYLPTTMPSSFGYFYSPALKRRIDSELATKTYDMTFVHCSSVASYVSDAKNLFKVIDFGDMDSQKWREYSTERAFPLSLGYWLEAIKLERTERMLAGQFDFATCTTRAELETLRSFGITTPTDWFPNGVDASFFTPVEDYDSNLLVFVGRMDYFPNQQAVNYFCKDVLPVIQAQRPEVRFEIVGADPTQQIRDLGRLPGVSVTGSVPDVRPYVTKAALTVAPLAIARGTQNKILESMAMGVPALCSREASGGVDATADEHLLVAADTQDYVAKVLQLLQSRDLRQRLALAGRERVLTNHSWSGSMRRLDVLLQGQMAARRAA
ncbi:MAG TPA: TIGR03087 family PEP-CTERM/XrtA system glycosyltransferase [Steroidobacteraceae bacterium]|nr:TIGR03087 family PEP-CTERM/XrtA system glycosyltransferase [Steroidobacteraceae bacterium]